MSIDPGIHTLADLKGRSVGITGVPADYAALESAGLRDDVKIVNVGYSLLPALLSHKVDAVLGVYRNVEGVELKQRGYNPTIIPLHRAGVPWYDELVLVANSDRLRSNKSYADMVGKFVDAFQTGQREAYIHPDRLDRDPREGHRFEALVPGGVHARDSSRCSGRDAWRRANGCGSAPG